MKWLKRIGYVFFGLIVGLVCLGVSLYLEYCGKYHHFIC